MSEKKSKKRNALGRGLGALLDDSISFDAADSLASPAELMAEIPISQIEANPYQPRTDFDLEALKELAESIKVQGIIQPVTLRKLGPRQYQLIAGERRLQASQIAGLTTIPSYVKAVNDQQMLEMALIENIQRENLNAMEIAVSYQRLLTECDLKQEELGERVGKNRTTVNNYLRLLKLPPDIQIGLRDQKISMGHARALVNVDNIEVQLALFRKIVKEELSVRKSEALVRAYVTGTSAKASDESRESAEEPALKQLREKLRSHFGSKVELKVGANRRGEIRIPFINTEDLNRILEIIDI